IGLTAGSCWGQVVLDEQGGGNGVVVQIGGEGQGGVDVQILPALRQILMQLGSTTQPECWVGPMQPGQLGRWAQMPVKVELVKASYLGIAAGPADAALRAQLSLPEGVGLAVQFVDPEGPSKAAGVGQHDVLWKLNDQLIINPEQLTVLVRTFKVGEEVKLTVIRQAKPQVIAVKLAEKEQPKLGSIRVDLIEQMGPPVMGGAGNMPMPNMPPMLPGGMAGAVGQCSISDGTHEITVTDHGNGSRHLLAKDKDGKVLFDGPIDTPEQRAKVPAGILKKIEGVKINVNPFAPAPGSDPLAPKLPPAPVPVAPPAP
ncbi:MAG: PDZ domain-containing protein, partial [Phycisphaerae bacterium]|nr:PDZ domain-containing protein [Phycisphaerae bacterium]